MIKINIKSNVNNYECKYNLETKNGINELNNISNKEIKTKINELINISKKYNYDFIGLQNYVIKHKDNIDLNNIKINILINNEINSIGEIRKWKKK